MGLRLFITIYYVTGRHWNPGQIGLHRATRVWPSKHFRREFGHTPVSVAEEIPWDCKRLVIGSGGVALPVMDQVKQEAEQRKTKLAILPTAEAIKELKRHPQSRNSSRDLLTCRPFPDGKEIVLERFSEGQRVRVLAHRLPHSRSGTAVI
jgi:hypothetical protein